MTKYYDDDCDQYDHDGKENKKKEHKETTRKHYWGRR